MQEIKFEAEAIWWLMPDILIKSSVIDLSMKTRARDIRQFGDYCVEIIRSDRRTAALRIEADGSISMRVPFNMSNLQIQDFIEAKKTWIGKTLEKIKSSYRKDMQLDLLSPEDLYELADRASLYIPQRVKYYAAKIGVIYGRVTIRCQRTRWGSCSSRGNLNFNCLLMLTPDEVIDSVVVHELCHLKEMNHSKNFYSEVYKVFPEYDKWHRWLKDNTYSIMGRLHS